MLFVIMTVTFYKLYKYFSHVPSKHAIPGQVDSQSLKRWYQSIGLIIQQTSSSHDGIYMYKIDIFDSLKAEISMILVNTIMVFYTKNHLNNIFEENLNRVTNSENHKILDINSYEEKLEQEKLNRNDTKEGD